MDSASLKHCSWLPSRHHIHCRGFSSSLQQSLLVSLCLEAYHLNLPPPHSHPTHTASSFQFTNLILTLSSASALLFPQDQLQGPELSQGLEGVATACLPVCSPAFTSVLVKPCTPPPLHAHCHAAPPFLPTCGPLVPPLFLQLHPSHTSWFLPTPASPHLMEIPAPP